MFFFSVRLSSDRGTDLSTKQLSFELVTSSHIKRYNAFSTIFYIRELNFFLSILFHEPVSPGTEKMFQNKVIGDAN